MKKLLLLSVLLVALCATAEDSYIYWMVSDSATMEDGTALTPTAAWTAKVVAFNKEVSDSWIYGGGQALDVYSSGANGTLGSPRGDSGVNFFSKDGNLPYYVNLASSVGGNWTYFVELYNDGKIFAHSEALPYDEASIAVLTGTTAPGTLWNVTAFVPAAVPEPSSGLLLLLGVAGLALRRRKQIAA